jgi:DNA modification methylase
MWHDYIITNGVEHTGIGSEGYVSIEMGRRFVGAELKPSYWELAKRNLSEARETQASGLFADEEFGEVAA